MKEKTRFSIKSFIKYLKLKCSLCRIICIIIMGQVRIRELYKAYLLNIVAGNYFNCSTGYLYTV